MNRRGFIQAVIAGFAAAATPGELLAFASLAEPPGAIPQIRWSVRRNWKNVVHSVEVIGEGAWLSFDVVADDDFGLDDETKDEAERLILAEYREVTA